MFDGGIRSGQDVVRAMASGAESCLLGRAFAYGLGAGGEAGVAKASASFAAALILPCACAGTAVGRNHRDR